MTLVDPGNPNTSSFAIAAIQDGSVFDVDNQMFGVATYYERLDVADPDPGMAARIADNRLRTLGGAVATMTIRCVPQPWLQPGQVIGVEYNGTRVVAQVAGWSMNIGDRSEMTVRLRAWRITSQVGMPVYPNTAVEEVSINRALPVGTDLANDALPTVPPKPAPVGAFADAFAAGFDTATGQAP